MRLSREASEPVRVSEEILAAAVCFAISGLFLSTTGGSGRSLDWIYPKWLLGVIAGIGVVLLIRGLLGHGAKREIVPPILRGEGVDVAVFGAIAVVYVVMLEPVGFWPMSMLMVFVASMVLAAERTRTAALVSAVTAILFAVLGHVVFRNVFYISFPEPPWWPM